MRPSWPLDVGAPDFDFHTREAPKGAGATRQSFALTRETVQLPALNGAANSKLYRWGCPLVGAGRRLGAWAKNRSSPKNNYYEK